MTDREPTIPLRELIHHGGFIFAMCGLVIFAVLMSLMGLGK